MSAYYMRLICLVACIALSSAQYSVNHGPAVYGDVIRSAETAEAQAAALTNAAGAAASAAKLDAVNAVALNNYGLEQGRPLLARSYGPLDNLYAASLPARSFVAEIDPAFQRIGYGSGYGGYGEKSIVLQTGSKVAATAI